MWATVSHRPVSRHAQAALGTLARLTRSRPNTFAFAGTKDKRAATVQAVTALRLADARLAGLNATLRYPRT